VTGRGVAPVPPVGRHLRRDAAVLLDLVFAVVCGAAGLLAGTYVHVVRALDAGVQPTEVSAFRAAVPALCGMAVGSFANQVLLTVATRGSVGKHLMGLRVVRTGTFGRPRFGQTVHRWLYGVVFMLAVLPLAVLGMDIGGPKGTRTDAMGLRITRRASGSPRGRSGAPEEPAVGTEAE
jgi:uncharacterized RDD family membrane protein YckC